MNPHQSIELEITNLLCDIKKVNLIILGNCIHWLFGATFIWTDICSMYHHIKIRNINNIIFFGVVLEFLPWPMHRFNHLMLTLSSSQFMSFSASECLILRNYYEQGENQTLRGYRKCSGNFVGNSLGKKSYRWVFSFFPSNFTFLMIEHLIKSHHQLTDCIT